MERRYQPGPCQAVPSSIRSSFTAITRRFNLLLSVLVFVALTTSAACCFGEDTPPNVVLIISDDQGWGDYSFMGHPQLETPNLDRLAAESLTFRRGYVPSSLCSPSLASIITGRYPHEHGITCNDPPNRNNMKLSEKARQEAFQGGRKVLTGFMEAQQTLPELLQPLGFQSFQTGKWWQGNYRSGGFTHGMTQGERHGDQGLDIGRKSMQPIYDFVQESRAAGKPFFVWYAPFLPHSPHNAPAKYVEKSKAKWKPGDEGAVGAYYANVLWHDEKVGELLDYLKNEKLEENTIVIYVTDNGWIQSPKKNIYAPKSKQTPYDGGLRTPIMVRWPGKVKPQFSDTPVSSLDILPTVLHAVGKQVPSDLPGINLLDEEKVQSREAIFGECFTHEAIDLQDFASGLRWRWVVQGRWKLIVPSSKNEAKETVELYDLQEDPTETKNLAKDMPAEVERLQALLDQRWDGGSAR